MTRKKGQKQELTPDEEGMKSLEEQQLAVITGGTFEPTGPLSAADQELWAHIRGLAGGVTKGGSAAIKGSAVINIIRK